MLDQVYVSCIAFIAITFSASVEFFFIFGAIVNVQSANDHVFACRVHIFGIFVQAVITCELIVVHVSVIFHGSDVIILGVGTIYLVVCTYTQLYVQSNFGVNTSHAALAVGIIPTPSLHKPHPNPLLTGEETWLYATLHSYIANT